jgi:hypothetical protein
MLMGHRDISHAWDFGNVQVVDGVVTDFTPARTPIPFFPSSSSFRFGKFQIALPAFSPEGAFTQASEAAGPLKNNLYVRLYFVDGAIVRIERPPFCTVRRLRKESFRRCDELSVSNRRADPRAGLL